MMNGINGFDEMVMTSTGSIYNATICFPKLINYKIWNYGIGSVEDVDLATETGFVRGLPPSADTVDLGKDVKLFHDNNVVMEFKTIMLYSGLLDEVSTSSQRLRVKSLSSSLIGKF